ncbi:cytochrome P450 [Pyrenophora seminiperda CCB06]|uniref:Cytochrome P450 n=1 Tax=Pyrenophora seminiperda CCB06 TaxID=1302712 RepID=A0A3M7LVG0_9PLEO|nr:cytochrome P450 [Pyrenophora seminiperda CCB06]
MAFDNMSTVINSAVYYGSVFLAAQSTTVSELELPESIYTSNLPLVQVYFHRLSKFPGPASRAAFYFPEFFHIFLGDSHTTTRQLHEQYGEVVRIVPDGLTFTSEKAWIDIYGTKANKRQLEKDRDFFVDAPTDVYSIIHSPDADHDRIRKQVSYAFSGTALREHEPLMKQYFDLLVHKFKQQIDDSPGKGRVDVTQWFNFTAFDIVSRLTLNDCFNLLEQERFNFWTEQIFKGIKLLRFLRVIRRYPVLWYPFDTLFRAFPKLQGVRNAHMNFAISRSEERLQRGSDIKDFLSYITRENDEKQQPTMTRDEVNLTAAVILIAGSETSATVLCGAAYNLARNPDVKKKAQAEVRAAFKSDEDITLASLPRLRYLSAVIEESLRCFPAVPGTFPRRTGPEGDTIAGRYVPADISVGVHQWSTYYSPSHFHNPEIFAPERWLPDPPSEYKNDKLGCVQPFHVGPRNCVGKNLAYLTIRSVLARLLWHFDWELCEESVGWHDQRSFILWDKPPLWLKISHKDDDGGDVE